MASKTEANNQQRQTFAREAMIHLDHLYRVAYHLAREPDAVQDLVQDTFLRALDSYMLFNPPTNMRAWLTKILQNIFIDQYRKERHRLDRPVSSRESTASWDHAPAKEADPERLVLKKELSRKIHHYLQCIPEEYRMPIVLIDMSEFSYAEAAEVLSCPVGTIRSRLSRGRKLLQDYLSGYIGSTDESHADDMRRSPRADHRPG